MTLFLGAFSPRSFERWNRFLMYKAMIWVEEKKTILNASNLATLFGAATVHDNTSNYIISSSASSFRSGSTQVHSNQTHPPLQSSPNYRGTIFINSSTTRRDSHIPVRNGHALEGARLPTPLRECMRTSPERPFARSLTVGECE